MRQGGGTPIPASAHTCLYSAASWWSAGRCTGTAAPGGGRGRGGPPERRRPDGPAQRTPPSPRTRGQRRTVTPGAPPSVRIRRRGGGPFGAILGGTPWRWRGHSFSNKHTGREAAVVGTEEEGVPPGKDTAGGKNLTGNDCRWEKFCREKRWTNLSNAGKNSGLQPKTARKNIGRKSLVNPFFREMQANSHQILRFS